MYKILTIPFRPKLVQNTIHTSVYIRFSFYLIRFYFNSRLKTVESADKPEELIQYNGFLIKLQNILFRRRTHSSARVGKSSVIVVIINVKLVAINSSRHLVSYGIKTLFYNWRQIVPFIWEFRNLSLID